MDGKKPAASIVDELFGPKDGKSSSSSSQSSGYFSTVFPPPSQGKGKDASQSDLYRTLDRQRDGKAKGSASSKNQSTGSKDARTTYPTESNESPYFGSSVHYGGRDFYGSSPTKQANEPPKTYKNDDNDGSAATRGDWWQGSLYY